MLEEGVQGQAVLWPQLKAGEDERAAVGAHVGGEGGLRAADVCVRLEGDVATDHVKEQDPK